jgi:hypothetical protein
MIGVSDDDGPRRSLVVEDDSMRDDSVVDESSGEVPSDV